MNDIPVHRFPPVYGDRPRLVRIEVREVEDEAGRRNVAVRAPDMPEDQEVVLSPDAFTIAGHFDGKHGIRDVQRAIYERYGQLLYVERIHALAKALFAAGLLEKSDDEQPVEDEKPADDEKPAEAEPSAEGSEEASTPGS